MNIKYFDEVEKILGKSASAFIRLVGYIRSYYAMDEFWFEGKSESAYHSELKFKRSGKTLVTTYIRDGFFKVTIILGKSEREMFENLETTFSDTIRKIYLETHTYHDGKWLTLDIYEDILIDDIIKLLLVKKKPNRNPENLINAFIGKCGNRCDKCLLYKDNNKTEKGNLLFQDGDWKCYHSGNPTEQVDYSKAICQGCHDDCAVVKCVILKGYDSCMNCDYNNCTVDTNNFTNPGRCNLGLTNTDLELFVLPYCGKERFNRTKINPTK